MILAFNMVFYTALYSMSDIHIYVLSGMCLVLFVILLFQSRHTVRGHSGPIPVKSRNTIVKMSRDELKKIIGNYSEKFKELRRHANSRNPNISKVVANIRRFTVANMVKDVQYDFPLVADFLEDPYDEPDAPYEILLYELARLEEVLKLAPGNLMLDLDAIEGLLMQVNDQMAAPYVGENLPSRVPLGLAPGSNGAMLAAALRFDDSVELDHRLHKPSRDIRPTQGEQSQEYEDF